MTLHRLGVTRHHHRLGVTLHHLVVTRHHHHLGVQQTEAWRKKRPCSRTVLRTMHNQSKVAICPESFPKHEKPHEHFDASDVKEQVVWSNHVRVVSGPTRFAEGSQVDVARDRNA